MKTLTLFALSLAVALAVPAPPPGVAQSPDLIKEEQSPLVGDLVPAQGHVEVQDPAPEPRLESKEQLEKSSPEVKEELKKEEEVKVEPKLIADPDFKVESEVKVDPDAQIEPESEQGPLFYAQEEPEVQIGELEPMDDDNMFGGEENDAELSEVEKSMRATFINQEPVAKPLPDVPAETDAGVQIDVVPETDEKALTKEGERYYLKIGDKGYYINAEPEWAEEDEASFADGRLASMTSPRIQRKDIIVRVRGTGENQVVVVPLSLHRHFHIHVHVHLHIHIYFG